MSEKVCVVGVRLVRRPLKEVTASLEELTRLTETAGGEVVQQFLQTKTRLDPATLIGKGKAQEIATFLQTNPCACVIFDENLTPAQQRNLEKFLSAKVLDRTRLILDIFAQRAHTREGRLQVELAQATYLLPRLTGRGTALSQQVGGIGTRGPGERQLEYDRRRLRDRIAKLRVEIENLRLHRTLGREKRHQVPLSQVALVGYTNVGKSTLFNALAQANGLGVYTDDKLFATLDPTTRRIRLPKGFWVLVTDTVGFIQKLPPHVVAAFRATLEEVTESDILVHVIDASHPQAEEQRFIVTQVLKDLGAEGRPCLVVHNKADLLTPQERTTLVRQGALLVSAKTGEGLEEFRQAIEKIVERSKLQVEVTLSSTQRYLLPTIYRTSQILEEKDWGEELHLTLRIDPVNWGRLQKSLRTSPTENFQ